MKTEAMKGRKRYTKEFKTQALELCAAGKPVAEVAEDLCISKDLIYAWRRKAHGSGQLRSEGRGAESDEDGAQELARLRREVAELRIDNDILKKAAVLLGTKNPGRPTK
ncbi:transposase [Roseibacillus ishigakijimensis]|uniref:Transposase n=1 Tax=Roseibacillus ishigakijimensis TaxID=454146 RepID=A0A934VMG6_9BACT|nr:transposase [Roseibacillus ishigakijimensis]MBK1835729.1 transposase [Roseibacillus ishigakijimensis]